MLSRFLIALVIALSATAATAQVPDSTLVAKGGHPGGHPHPHPPKPVAEPEEPGEPAEPVGQ